MIEVEAYEAQPSVLLSLHPRLCRACSMSTAIMFENKTFMQSYAPIFSRISMLMPQYSASGAPLCLPEWQ